MPVTIKINGADERVLRRDQFPTEAELKRLNFKGTFRTLEKFEQTLDNLIRNSKEHISNGNVEFEAVLRNGKPAIVVREKE